MYDCSTADARTLFSGSKELNANSKLRQEEGKPANDLHTGIFFRGHTS